MGSEGLMLIGLEPIQRIIELALASGKVVNNRPVSVLMQAETGSGKSELLKAYRGYPGAEFMHYTSIANLLEQYGKNIERRKIHHLIIQDLGVVTRRPKDTAINDLSHLNSLIEEGIQDFLTLPRRVEFSYPIKAGIISSIAPGDIPLLQQRAPAGFLSRFVWVFFEYQASTQAKIVEVITQLANQPTPYIYPLPPDNPIVAEEDDKEFLRFIKVADDIKQPDDAYGFRMLRHLCQLSRSHALLHNKTRVDVDDMVEVGKLSRYFVRQIQRPNGTIGEPLL